MKLKDDFFLGGALDTRGSDASSPSSKGVECLVEKDVPKDDFFFLGEFGSSFEDLLVWKEGM